MDWETSIQIHSIDQLHISKNYVCCTFNRIYFLLMSAKGPI